MEILSSRPGNIFRSSRIGPASGKAEKGQNMSKEKLMVFEGVGNEERRKSKGVGRRVLLS